MSETESRLLKAVNYNCGYALMDACQEIDAGKIIMDERGNEIDRLRAENEHLNNIINSTTVNIGYMEDNDRLRASLAAMTADRDAAYNDIHDRENERGELRRRLELAEAVFTALGKFRSVKAIGLKRDLEALDDAIAALEKATQP
jgi:hypothetical protein